MATKNPFDQFDPPATPKKANVFDAFDGQTKPSSAARYLADTGLSLGQGVVQGAQMLTNVAGADNTASKALGSASKALATLQSPYRKAEQANRARLVSEAEQSGSLVNEIGANLGAFAEAPIDTTVNALGTSAPTLAAAMLTGGASLPAQVAARVLPGVMGGAQGVGAVKGSIYEAVGNQALPGETPEQTEARAAAAQAYDSPNASQIALGGALGVLAGTTGIESVAGRLTGRAATKAAAPVAPATITDVAKAAGVGALKEAPLEGLQGGQERVAGNIALQNEGIDTPTFQGAIGQGVLEAAASAPLGAGFGAAERLAQRPAAPGQPPAPPAPAAPPPAPFVNPPSLTGTNAADLLAGQGGGLMGSTDPLRTVVRPPQAMGIDPSAGPLSRVAAAAVDSGVTDQTAMDEARANAIQAEDAAGQPDQEAAADPDAPLIAAIAAYNEDMQGMASPSTVSSRFGITVQRAAELLTKALAQPATPAVDDLFPPPTTGAQDEPDADAPAAVDSGVGEPVGADADGGAGTARGADGAAGGRVGGGAGAPDAARREDPAAPDAGRDANPALTTADEQDPAPQARAEAAPPAPAPVEAPAAAGGDAAAAPGVPDQGGTDAAAPAVSQPAPAGQITKADLDRIEVPDMTDDQLRAGLTLYGAVTRRANKIRKEIQKRGLEPKSPAPQPQEPRNEAQQKADARPDEPDEARQEAGEEGVLSDGAQAPETQQATSEGREQTPALLSDQVSNQAPAADEPASVRNELTEQQDARGRAIKVGDKVRYSSGGIVREGTIGSFGPNAEGRIIALTTDGRTIGQPSRMEIDVIAPEPEVTSSQQPLSTAEREEMERIAGRNPNFQWKQTVDGSRWWAEATGSSLRDPVRAYGSTADAARRNLLGKLRELAEQRQADEPSAAPAEKLAPFTRVNGPAERAAADRLQALYDQMVNINQRNTREGNAKATVRTVIEELRKPRTVSSVVPMLNGAANGLDKNYSAMADVIREVADALGGRAAPAPAPAPAPATGPVERRPKLTGASRIEYPTFVAGMDTQEGNAAQRKVVDYMNGDVSRTELMAYLGQSGIPEGQIYAFTQRLEEDAPTIGEVEAMLARRDAAGEPDPQRGQPVNVPPTVDAALTRQMEKQKNRLARMKRDADQPGMTLAEKASAQTKVKAAEATLRQMRLKRFDAEDAALRAIEAGSVEPFAEYADLFSDAADAVAALIPQAAPVAAAPAPAAQPRAPQIGEPGYTLLQARNDLADLNSQIEEQGQVADARLVSRRDRLRTIIKDMEKEQAAPAPAAAPSPAPATQADALSEREKAAKAKMFNALGKLAALASKNTRMNWTPEEEQQLLPIVIELFDGAMELGAVKFKQAVAYVREFIAQGIDSETADAIPFETLQGAYIAVAGRHKDKPVTPKREVAGFESLDELNAQEDNETPAQPQASTAPTSAQPEIQNDPAGNGADDAEPLDPELPQGNPGLAQDVAPEASASVRGTDADGNGRPDRWRDSIRTGVGRGKKPILSGAPAEVRPVGRSPVGPAPDATNQLFGEAPSNYEITDADAIGEGTAGQKLRANMEAIRTLRRVQAENRNATPEEQATMAKFVGWGGLRALIDPNTTGKQWLDARAELLGTNGQPPLLVGGDKGSEWIALQRSTTAAHYTAPEIVRSMWEVVRHFGFTGGRVLEPTSGIGNFIGLQPRELAAASEWHGAELDLITGQMAKLIYPEASIAAGIGFQDVPFAKGAFDLAIGNPPFGSLPVKSSIPAYKDMPEMKIHNFIISKTGEHLRPGGVMAMVVTHRFLDTANPEAREHLAKGFKFLGAFRLPNDAFLSNANTEVTTDVIFLQKLHVGEKATDLAWLDTQGTITVDGQSMRVNRYYEQNPANILGRSAMDGTMYAGRTGREGGEYTVHSDGRDLRKAITDLTLNQWASLKDVAKPTNSDQSAAAVMIEQSDLAVGGVMLDESGKLMRREMDDEAGNAVIVEITPQTIWKDGGDKWKTLADAAAALKTATDIPRAADLLRSVASVAYNAKGEKKPSPTKAEQAVYDMVDAAMAPGFRWQYDAQLATITATLERKKLGADGYQALKGLIGLRNTTLRLIEAERSDNTAAMDALRAQLNTDYDAFVAQNGYISNPENANLLDGDVGVESGLEAGYKPRNGKIKASARKADIFTQRVNFPYREVTFAKDAADGLQVSLSERGRLDIAYIAKLTGKPATEVISDLSTGENPLIFLDPETNEYIDADAYLSGNVKAKLDRARAAGRKANVRALEAVQPPPKTKDNVRPSIRGAWMPEKVFADFLADVGVRSPKVSIIQSQGMILASGSGFQETEFGAQFKNSNKSVVEIFNAAASGKPINIFVEGPDGNRVKNEPATKEVNLLVERMSTVFNEWAWSNDDRIQSVVDAFNEKMNTHVARKYDGRKYLKTVGASPSIELRTSQKNAAWRIVQAQTVLLDHVVGAGKTFTVITGAMQRRRLGLSRKPMIVVPNHLVTQWAKDFYALYPGAKILAATPDDFAKNKRRRLFSRIATGDFDAVIIGHSSLSFIETPAADQQMVINEQISELQEVLNELKAKKESGRTLTQIQEKLQKYEGKLKELQELRRDEIGIDLEAMGVDYLAVDEMHEFKNLEYSTAGERVVGMNDPKGSKKAFDLYLKIRGLIARGGAVTGATGTPVSNSLVELYTMMKYLAHKDLAERSQLNFDAWAGAYARTETKLEYTATQKLKPRRVLAGLNNLSALKQLYEQFGDVISMADLKRMHTEDMRAKNAKEGTSLSLEFPVPRVKGGARVLASGPITEQQSSYMDYLVARMQAIEANKRDKEYARIDNPLYVLTDARKMSLDIRIVDPTAPRDENGKVMRAAANIVSTYEKWDKYRGTQMVFCDLSTPAKNAVKEARSLIRESVEKLFGTGADAKRIAARVKEIPKFAEQWRYIESLAAEVVESPNTDPEVADKMEAYLAGLEDVDATMTTADVGFSVYDDMKKVLVERGIPEAEIAFIHDYNTPEQKAKLFAEVNDGTIRVLMGSSAKMGAGTNAQKRLVALHHMDAPWRPSDVEQREGRIIRQGNGLYGAIHDYGLKDVPADLLAKAAQLKRENPDGFEVEITAYSTAGTSDAVMWQVLERKSRAIEEFRSSDMDATDEEGSDSNQYAEFMAQSTGNPVFRLKLEAEREVDLLDTDSRGALLAKGQAQRFLKNYDEDLRDYRSAIEYAQAINVDQVKIGRESGSADEFQAVMDAATQRHEKAYADFLTKKEAAERDLAEWMGLTELERGDKPKMPVAPSMPNVLSKSIQEGSGYARAIKAALENGTAAADGPGYEFQVGTMRLRVRKLLSDDLWSLDAWNGYRFETLTWGEGKTAESSTKLANAMMPANLRDVAAKMLEEAQRQEKNLTSQFEVKKKLAEKNIDTGKLQAARKVMEWYRTQVSFAEQQADMRRGERPNRYIQGDRRRDLTQTKAELGDTGPVEFEGEVFRPTGFRDGYLLQATGADGREVLLDTRLDKEGNRSIEKVIEKPREVEFSGLMQAPARAPGADDAYSIAGSGVDGATGPTDTRAYGPATQAHRDAVGRIRANTNERLRQGGGRPVVLDAVTPGTDARGNIARSVAKLAREIFGREVIFVKFEGPALFNGLVSNAFPGKVFLNVESETPLLAVLGHELLHQMARTSPGLYRNLSQRLARVLKDANIYGDVLKLKYRQIGIDPSSVNWMEELEADIVGDNFMDPEFWNLVSRDQPGLFRRMAEKIMRWLDYVAEQIGAQRPFNTDRFLSDIAQARAAVADAVRQFSAAEVGAVSEGERFQIAYHGTPAKGIKRFSTDFIGNGEGAQAYGWGLYFASKREVADYYREKLTRNPFAELNEFAWEQIGAVMQKYGIDGDQLPGESDSAMVARILSEEGSRMTEAERSMLRSYLGNDGQLYEVNIPEDSEMLLWDKPLAEQSESIKAALRKMVDAILGDGTFDAYAKNSTDVRDMKDNLLENMTDREVSLAMLDAGIKGIKYLDGQSRGARDGTFNYVLFDGADAAIVDAKYSVGDAGQTGVIDMRFSIADVTSAARNAPLPAGYIVNDFIKTSGKVSAWSKTVGTMYDLAQKQPLFKPVFDAAQQFLSDVSFYASEAANLAPTILPKLETLRDITKAPLAAADNKAIAAPIFEGTLTWTRGPDGKPMRMVDMEAQAAKLTTEQKGQELLRKRLLDPKVLRMWQGLPIDQYAANVESRYASQVLKGGIVFTPDELKSMFGLNDKQVGLYQEFRAATDKSITDMAVADMVRFGGADLAPVKDLVLEAGSLEQSAQVARDYLVSLAEADPDRDAALSSTAASIMDKAAKARELIDRGYAPLSRFGRYSVDVVGADGERLYFGLFETSREAQKMVRQMRENYPDASVASGTMSEEAYKLFSGVTPETLELFGEMLGLEPTGDEAKDRAFQDYLKLAKNQRSAMKRLIHRKGIAGFSEDPGRVLAGFIYSNARQTAGSLNLGDLKGAINNLREVKGQGELTDIAMKLGDYVSNPQEEAQAIRSVLFAQYLGGSLASAMLNALQPVQVTLPYLSQFGGPMRAAGRLKRAIQDVLTRAKLDDGLAAALKRAEEEGIVSPQEVFQLQAQAAGRATLSGGDGTRLGDAAAAGNNALSRVMLVWGKLFGAAEQFNRRVTFIAAYRTATEQRLNDPAAFAKRAVDETQFIYNKGNKPQWARGAVGATLFTFKQYSISYVELMTRLARSGPEGRKAALLGIGVLVLMSGLGGLPFIEDLDDVIDGFMQRVMGRNFSSKQARQEFFADLLGEGGADFVLRGLSGLPGSPVDVSGRLGLGNMIPGTGILQKKESYGRDLLEIAGPAGDMAKRTAEAAALAAQGEVFGQRGALATISPVAARNLLIAHDMAMTGSYQDQQGRKVIDTTPGEAAFKAVGFQPASVDRVQDASFVAQRMISLNKIREKEIADKWARGVYLNDPAMVQDARSALEAWNQANPESPIRINMRQIFERVRNMRMDKTERLAKTAPKEIRDQVRAQLESGR